MLSVMLYFVQRFVGCAVLPTLRGCEFNAFLCFLGAALQALWIQGQRGEAKKAGILAAVAKVPTLLKKLQAAADAAVDSKGKGKRQARTVVLERYLSVTCAAGLRWRDQR